MIKNSFLIILGLFLIHSNSSEAFLWGLTQEEESICRKRASKKQNSFSAKKTYDFCKKNIRKDKNKRKKYENCMSNYQDEIGWARLESDSKIRELKKEAKNNTNLYTPPTEYGDDKVGKANKAAWIMVNGLERKILIEKGKLDNIISGFTSKCRKKAGY